MQITPFFKFGDIVYAKTDTDHAPGIIVGYVITPKDILYSVSFNGRTDYFFDYSNIQQ